MDIIKSSNEPRNWALDRSHSAPALRMAVVAGCAFFWMVPLLIVIL